MRKNVMWFLGIQIVATALFSLCYKVAERKKNCKTSVVHLTMYTSATFLCVVSMTIREGWIFDWRVIVLGAMCGFCLFIAMRTFFFAMSQGGLAVGWTIVNMAVVIPLIVSVVFWKQIPGKYQEIGFLLMVPCILLFGNLSLQVKGSQKRWWILVIIATVATGFVQVLHNIVSFLPRYYSHLSDVELQFNYMFWMFLSGGMCLLVCGVLKDVQLRSTEVKIGAIMGFFSIIGTWGMIKALEVLPGTVCFPLKAVCGVILTAILAVVIWGEHLSKRQIIGIILGALSAMLVNLKS